MRKKITPFPLTLKDENLIDVLHLIGADSWKLKKVEINGIDYTIQRNELKNRIKNHLSNEQDGHCAYCSSEPSPHREIDHFAKKSIYPNLTWNPNNLLSSCLNCNHRRKGTKNFVVNVPVAKDRLLILDALFLEYNIVNPILDDPLEHLTWDNLFIICSNKTLLGKNTIEKFEIMEPYAAQARSAMSNKKDTILSNNDETLIEIIVSKARFKN